MQQGITHIAFDSRYTLQMHQLAFVVIINIVAEQTPSNRPGYMRSGGPAPPGAHLPPLERRLRWRPFRSYPCH